MSKTALRQKRRDEFAQAAYSIIVERGFSSVTIRDVAERAGFTTGALVHYAPTKDALLRESHNFVRRLAYQRLLDAHRLDGITALKHLLYWFLPVDGKQNGYWSIRFNLWERAKENSDMYELLQESDQELLAWIEQLLNKIQKSDDIAVNIHPKRITRTAIALIEGLSISILAEGKMPADTTPRDIVDQWIDDVF